MSSFRGIGRVAEFRSAAQRLVASMAGSFSIKKIDMRIRKLQDSVSSLVSWLRAVSFRLVFNVLPVSLIFIFLALKKKSF